MELLGMELLGMVVYFDYSIQQMVVNRFQTVKTAPGIACDPERYVAPI